MRLRTRMVWASTTLLVLIVAGVTLLRKPTCNCYFPVSKEYGILSAGGGHCQAETCAVSPEFRERISSRLKALKPVEDPGQQ